MDNKSENTRSASEPAFDLVPCNLISQLRLHGWTARAAGAVCGFCGGVLAAIFGSLITLAAWFDGSERHGVALHRYGTVLLFLTIPLLIFGAHCLDLMDKADEEASGVTSKIDQAHMASR